MQCKDCKKQIDDFIYDKIKYSDDLKDFLEHVKSCDECMEELELYYTIHRGLEDVAPPVETEQFLTIKEELDYIFKYYNDYFLRQKKIKVITIVLIALIVTIIVSYMIWVGVSNI
jgi:hypothetical protein